MKRRILPLLLALILLLSTSALAYTDNTANFTKSKSYTSQFSDLSPSSVFYSNVAALYEYGLSVGKADGTFGITDSVKVSQIIIFAGRIRSLYRTGDPEQGAKAFQRGEQETYEPYLLYLQSEGILGRELDGSYLRIATRGQVAHILARTLPAAALPTIGQDTVQKGYASGKFISDVTAATTYQQDILTLYACGVSQGSDATGSYHPDAAITRGALAAMLTRMVDPSLRTAVNWDLTLIYSARNVVWSDLITTAHNYIAAPRTTAEIEQDVAYMLFQGESTLTLRYYTALSDYEVNQLMQTALDCVKTYCEQCYNQVRCLYNPATGVAELYFSAVDVSPSDLSDYRDFTLSAAIAVHDQLWADGTITAAMTQTQKARAYYTWICQHCIYDSTNYLSHLAYSLFHDGTAVCDGYTGAYNLLLKLEGIDCYALSNASHIWTVAVLDGVQYHIDTTWGDGIADVNYAYFAMDAASSWRYHHW